MGTDHDPPDGEPPPSSYNPNQHGNPNPQKDSIIRKQPSKLVTTVTNNKNDRFDDGRPNNNDPNNNDGQLYVDPRDNISNSNSSVQDYNSSERFR